MNVDREPAPYARTRTRRAARMRPLIGSKSAAASSAGGLDGSGTRCAVVPHRVRREDDPALGSGVDHELEVTRRDALRRPCRRREGCAGVAVARCRVSTAIADSSAACSSCSRCLRASLARARASAGSFQSFAASASIASRAER